MLRLKKAPFVPIFPVSILVLVCLIAAQRVARHGTPKPHGQTQIEPPGPRAVLSAANAGAIQEEDRLRIDTSY